MPAPPEVVSVDVRVDDVGDPHAEDVGLIEKPVLITSNNVHRYRPARSGATEKIGQRRFLARKLLKKHLNAPPDGSEYDDFFGPNRPIGQFA